MKLGHEVARAGVRRVLLLTLLLNVLVSAGKIVVGSLSGSLSMVADGYHSLLDGANNVVGLIVTVFAYAPPDRDHPYGHRKFETSATLVIGVALLTLAYEVVRGALTRVREPRLPEIDAINWVVMGATLAVNVFVTRYEFRQGQRLGSEYLLADATHTRSDIYVSLGVIASFAGARAGLPWVDPLVAVAIAGFITFLAVRIVVGSFHVLTDRAAIAPEAIERALAAVSEIRALRDVRTRGGADAAYVDLTVHLDGDLTLHDAHAVADRIEETLRRAHPGIVDVVVHLEPSE